MHRKITCFYGYDKASAWESRGFIHFSGMFCNSLSLKGKPIIQQKCLFGSYIANYADIGYLCRTLMDFFSVFPLS